jgi:autotransporter-associated beta strand protein
LQQGSCGVYDKYSLGTTYSGTTISAGGRVDLTGNGLNIAEPFVVAGTLGSSSSNITNDGPIQLIASNACIRTLSGGLTINSVISGSGGFTKTESGYLELKANNTYQGTTVVSNGTLRVNGLQPQSAIIVASHGTWLGGVGAIGDVSISDLISTLSPGGLFSASGILTCSNVTIVQSAEYRVELNGMIPGSGYDQLNVLGVVNLQNCRFRVSLGFPAAKGAEFIIIANDGSDAVQGMFQNLLEGAIFAASGALFQISYTGGDGNDVVLTRMDEPHKLSAITVLPNGPAQIQGDGLSNVIYSIMAATNLTPSIQ